MPRPGLAKGGFGTNQANRIERNILLKRREFLAVASGVTTAVALGSRVVAPSFQEATSVDPLAHGARGDGRPDDLEAINRALAIAASQGLPLDGGNRVYAVSGNLSLTRATRPWIRSLRLKQLDPVSGRRTLFLDQCEAIRIDSLQIDVGSNRRAGDMNSTAGLWIEGGANHNVCNVEVFGHGKHSLIAVWGTRNSIFNELTVRDAQFDDPNARDDVMQGIWLSANADLVLRNARVANLTGNASYVGQRLTNLRTRGITLGGNSRVSIVNAQVTNVDQGIDLTGSEGNRDCSVLGGRTHDCGSVGVKLANSAVRCRVEGHVAERAGMYGFLASGPAETSLPFKTQDCDFIRCTAIDAGYNRIFYPNPSGFQVRMGDYDRHLPSGIRFIGCRAIDRQAVKTMKYGFYSDVGPQLPGYRPNSLIDCTSKGHSDAERFGVWQ